MDLLEDLGFSLEDLQGEEEEEEETALETTDVVVAASRFQSGRSAARHANGNGKLHVGSGPMALDWRGAVERMMAADGADQRAELARALGTLAQVQAHGDPMSGRECAVKDANGFLGHFGESAGTIVSGLCRLYVWLRSQNVGIPGSKIQKK